MFKTVVAPATTYTVKEAESKLLQIDEKDIGKEVSLRRAFFQPPGIYAEDVLVQREICLKQGKGVENREKLARDISNVCHDILGREFSATSPDNAKLILTIYICDAATGNRDDRVYASETGNGHVRLTIAWILALKDGSVVLDGGRLSHVDGHCYGFGDLLKIANPDKTIRNMAYRMARAILKQSRIKSKYGLCNCGALF